MSFLLAVGVNLVLDSRSPLEVVVLLLLLLLEAGDLLPKSIEESEFFILLFLDWTAAAVVLKSTVIGVG